MNECGCKYCYSTDCRGCNMLILERALHEGVFDTVMTQNRCIDIDVLREQLQHVPCYLDGPCEYQNKDIKLCEEDIEEVSADV